MGGPGVRGPVPVKRQQSETAAPRSRAAGAPATRRRRAVWEARARAARVQTAGEDLVVVVVVVVAATPNYLRQASPDRRKYRCK